MDELHLNGQGFVVRGCKGFIDSRAGQFTSKVYLFVCLLCPACHFGEVNWPSLSCIVYYTL